MGGQGWHAARLALKWPNRLVRCYRFCCARAMGEWSPPINQQEEIGREATADNSEQFGVGSSLLLRLHQVVKLDSLGRLPRPTGDDLIYHAINRGYNRADVLGPDGERDMFLGDLARTKARYPFSLFGYCLMSNHFHLLLKPAPRAVDQPHPPVPDRRSHLAAPPETGNQRPRLAGPLPIPGHPGRRPPARRSEVHRGQPGAGRDGGRSVRVYLVEPPLPWRRACRSHSGLVPGMGAGRSH